MLLTTRNKKDTPTYNIHPFAIPEYGALSGMNKHLMLPCVGMLWCKTACLNGKNPHAKITGAIAFADDDSTGYPFDCIIIKNMTLRLRIMDYFHGGGLSMDIEYVTSHNRRYHVKKKDGIFLFTSESKKVSIE
jgi:hypothetical protein